MHMRIGPRQPALASAFIFCCLAAGCRDAKQRQTAVEPVVYRAFNSSQAVVAVADLARFVVTKSAGRLTIWSSSGVQQASRAAMVEQDVPGAWYAISPDGQLMAEADDKSVRITQLQKNKIHWTADLSGGLTRLWGAPVFSPDQRLVALPMQGRVSLLDAEDGKLLRHIGHTDNWVKTPLGRVAVTPSEGITLARQVVFSADSSRLAITCGTSAANPSNHTVFVADVTTGKILAELPGHAEAVQAVKLLPGGQLATADGRGRVRLFTVDGLQRVVLSALDGTAVTRIAVRGDLDQVLFSDHQGRVLVWRAKEGKRVEIRPADARGVAFLGYDKEADKAVVLLRDGELQLTKIGPATDSAPPAQAQRLDTSPELMAGQAAIWQLARAQVAEAQAALRPFGADHSQPMLTAAHHFAGFMGSAKKTTFASYLEEHKAIGPLRAGVLELAATYADSAVLGHATPLYSTWVDWRLKQGPAGDEDTEARRVCLLLADHYGSVDDINTRESLLVEARNLWFTDLAIGLAYVRTIHGTRPEQAPRLAERLTQQHPKTLAVWQLYIEILTDFAPDRLAGAVEAAKAALDPKQAETWAFLGQAYLNRNAREQALKAFAKAVELAPDNPDYRRRLQRLQPVPAK